MTATEKLRRLLDERGVEHRDATPDILHDVTNWVTRAWLADGRWFQAIETQKGDLTLELYGYSPAQAIDATLGRGTCHDLAETPKYRDKTEFKCSECGYEYSAVGGFGCDYGDEPDFRYCPNCGRRCVG